MTTDLDESVTRDDGTILAWRSIGEGPGLVVVHGAMQSGESQSDLARLLGASRRVHLLDRRGRARSGGSAAATTAQEVDDLRAVISATGATAVLGVSSGAIIAARAALADERIERLVLFEPPLSLGGSMRLDLTPRLTAALDAGNLGTVMAYGMRIAEMGPPWMFGLPIPLLAAMSRLMLRSPDVADRARGLRADMAVVTENADRVGDFAAIDIPTLVISGTATRPYLLEAAAALAHVVPTAQAVALPDQWHGATQNASDRGRPELVAPAVLAFLDEPRP